jgi:molybdate transport system substrate-binding protein
MEARAADIRILTNMGVVSAVRDVAAGFERASGHKVTVLFETGPAFMQRIDANAPADIVTHSPEGMDALIRGGKVVPGTKVDFARAGIGVVVQAGVAKPDIATPEAFRRTLLAAKSIAYSGKGASGLAMAQIVERLGIAGELKARTTHIDGRPVAHAVASGEVALGVQQINTVLGVAGTDYVGPLPPALQVHIAFSAGLLAIAWQPEAAREMLAFMVSPQAAPLIRKSGMEPMRESTA